jgi:two-component system chemotaxis response regulator CheY
MTMIQTDHAEEPQHGARILVIDDALTVRLFCKQLLTGAGFRVTEAINGLEALEIALQEEFDLFLVDINMQKMDGYAFLSEARRHAGLAEVPAIMMSTEAGSEDVSRAWNAGANFYLFKPLDPERLVTAARLMTGSLMMGSLPL